MAIYKKISEDYLVTETTYLDGLTIAEGARLLAPEGKVLSMTMGGEGVAPVPGVYEGNIVLTVTDRIPLGTYPFRAAICAMDGKYRPEMSVEAVVKTGTSGDGISRDVSIVTRDEDFNGYYIGGNGNYEIDNANLRLEGNGGNDFVGFGAGIFVGDNANVAIHNSTIRTRGAARGTMFLCGECNVLVTDSTLEGQNGVLPADYIDTVTPGVMRTVPWMLGLRGNCRAFNLAESATATFKNCVLRSEGWGVMSTDGVRKGRLYMENSEIEITGTSGYGAFSINDCLVSYQNCHVKVPDYAMIIANGSASGKFSGGTQVESKRFGILCFRNISGKVEVEPGTQFKTGEAVFLLKGCTPQLDVRGATLHSQNGIILQAMDLDDPGTPEKYYRDPEGPDEAIEGRNLTSAVPGEDIVARFEDMEICGDFYNSTSNRKAITDVLDPNAPKAKAEPPYSGGPGTHQGAPGGKGPGVPGGPGAGGPGATPPKDGEMPEMFKKMFGLDRPQPKNLALYFKNASVTGIITAASAKHRVPMITKENAEEIGEVLMTAGPAVNNGVNVFLEEGAAWTVTGTSYLTSLEISESSNVCGADGKSVKLTVDGKEVLIEAGRYSGKLVLSLA